MSNQTRSNPQGILALKDTDPVAAQAIAEFVKTSSELVEELKADKQALVQKLAAANQKQASASPLTAEGIETAVANCVMAGFIETVHQKQACEAITADPAVALLGFIDKLAKGAVKSRAGVPSLGAAIPAEKGNTQKNAGDEESAADKAWSQTTRALRALNA
ncbi:MAG TPA: hypothetical protein VM537_19270 [Anaerolineae bacterium]|nr:hypothetical protein [Anaerolineae bacterium]